MLRAIWSSRPPLASLITRRVSAANPAPGAFVQHVRIKNRRRIRNVAIGAGVMYVCWSVYLARVVVPPLAKHLEEDGEPIFFPFPFRFKVLESRPYKGTDPEWQEYIRIARDRELLLKIRDDILDKVQRAAEANPILVQKCGRQMKVRKHWLDLDFPYRPPPKFFREGLLLSPDGLEVASKEIDPTTMMQIARALWPVPVAQSATSFVGTLVRQNLQSVARYFGFEVAEPPPISKLAAVLKKKLEEAERRSGQGGPGMGNSAHGVVTAAGPSASAASTPGSKIPAEGRQPGAAPAAKDDPGRIVNAKDLIPFESVRSSIDGAWGDFKKKLAQTWLPLRPQPPAGSVKVSGLVELRSQTARIMIEVTAYWNPKTRQYDGPTLFMKLRSIRPRNQVPL